MNLKNIKISQLITDSAYIFTSVFPLALSMAVCSGIGAAAGIAAAAAACLLISINKTRLIMPVFASYLVISFTFKEYGLPTTAASIALSGAMLIALAFMGFDFKQVVFKPVLIAVMLATALSVTVLETTLYFGIGATGNIVSEMIASYRSLGFHPNWRGVLYGTIVLVIMITYPRKFKKIDGIIRAPFITLALTLILNILLNPADMTSAIKEIGAYKPDTSLLFPSFGGNLNLTGIITSGFALFITTAYSVCEAKGSNLDYAATGAANCLCSAFAGAFVPVKSLTHKHISIAGIPAALLSIVILLLCDDFIARIPVASCAVILIVGAWQSVKWGEIKKAFIDVPSLASFIAVLAFTLIFGIIKGLMFGALCSFICSFLPSAKHFANDE